MLKAFEKIKLACDLKAVMPRNASVTVVDGFMVARNAVLTACVPCTKEVNGETVPFDDFAVAAVDLERVARGQPDDVSVNVTEKRVVVSSSIGRSQIARTDGWEQPFKKPDIETRPVPKNLKPVLDRVIPFAVGDGARAWTEAARFDGTTVTATNAMILIQEQLASDSGFEGVTIPKLGLRYMRERSKELKAWGIGEKTVLLEFSDDSWCAIAHLAAGMPDQAFSMIKKIDDKFDNLREVKPETRIVIQNACDRTEKFLDVDHRYIHGLVLATDHRVPFTSGMPEGEVATFVGKDLMTVVDAASAIGFNRFPNPIPFTTESGGKGLLASYRKPR